MHPRTKLTLTSSVLAVLSLTATACGLKGPLYRPDEAKDETVAPTGSTATPKKKDSASSSAPTSEQSEQSLPPVAPPDPDRPAVPPGR